MSKKYPHRIPLLFNKNSFILVNKIQVKKLELLSEVQILNREREREREK